MRPTPADAARPRDLPAVASVAAGLLILAVLVVLDLQRGIPLGGTFAGGAVVAAIAADGRRTAAVAVLATGLAALSGTWHDYVGTMEWGLRLLACVLVCTAAVVAAELAHRRRQRLEHTTALAQAMLDALAGDLPGARTVGDVATVFTSQVSARLGALLVRAYVLDPDDRLRPLGRLDDAGTAEVEVPLDAPLPLAEVAGTGVSRHLRRPDDIRRALPETATPLTRVGSVHLLPLKIRDADDQDASDRPRGVLLLAFPRSDVSPRALHAFLGSLALAFTEALRRAEELAETDAVAVRLELLSAASARLTHRRTVDEVVEETCRLAVPRFADWCAVQLLQEDGLLSEAVIQHRDPETTRWARGLQDAYPSPQDAPTGSPAVARTGVPEHYAVIPDELIEAGAQSPAHLALLRRLGLRSAVVVPIRGEEDRVVGVLTLINADSGRLFGAEDVALADELAGIVGAALDSAADYEQQVERLETVTRVAEAAQRAILAPPPSRVGRLELAARYRSAVSEALVGGDLYEVVRTAEGVRLLIGDVRGKGLGAVRTATVVLGAFRSAAVGSRDVAAAARVIEELVRPHLPDAEDFVTATLVEVRHDGSFAVASCGHPAPVVLGADGASELEVDPDVPIGLGSAPRLVDGRLEVGESLVLFTDGLIEARLPSGDFVDHLPVLDEVGSGPLEAGLDAALCALQRATGGALADDLALLAVRLLESDDVD